MYIFDDIYKLPATLTDDIATMKLLTSLLFFLYSTFIFSQTKIKIDTLEINFRINGIVDFKSIIPQIRGEINSEVKTKINDDIREYFMASIHKDSATYVKNLLIEYDSKNLADYFEKLRQGEIINTDSENESFVITYISDNLLNFTYSHSLLPTGGQPMSTFTSAIYDLSTGKKLDFSDFISIDKKNLISIFRREGYNISWLSDPDKPFEIVPINPNDEYVEENLKDLFLENDGCIKFYFEIKDKEIHLLFTFLCAGPQLQDYGISLSKLKPYIKYYEFKNEYKLWGKDIYSLIGYDYLTLGNKIEFDEYTITNSGSGFLLSNDNNARTNEYGIAFCHSLTKTYYLFIKYQTKNDKKNAIISDIIEIDKKELKDNKLTEYCETKKAGDTEIIALVKDTKDNPEYYMKIIKAWRANRKTGKFESVKRNKISRCGNESNGI